MGILKYTDANGVTHGINSYKINPVIVAQSKGDSETAVMSQKAVSDEVEQLDQKIDTEVSAINEAIGGKANKSDLNSLAEAATADLNAIAQTVDGKANSSDVYTKTEIDVVVSTVNTALNSKLPIDSFNEWSENVPTKEQVNAKANSADVYDKAAIDGKVDQLNDAIADTYTKTEIDGKVDELNDAIEELEAVEVWDAGEY